MKVQKPPQLDSVRKLARFWNMHDLTEFEDELKEVSQPVFPGADLIRLHLRTGEANPVSTPRRI